MSQTNQPDDPYANVRAGMSVHHGKTPAAWAGSLTALVGFFVGGIGLVLGPNWLVFWIGVAITVVALLLTVILRSVGMGARGMAARASDQSAGVAHTGH